MTKLTILGQGPALILIPGGPGMSSNTLRSLDVLSKQFTLHYVDHQGTNDSEYKGPKSFIELAEDLSKVLVSIQGPKYLLGHSYGGYLAAEVAQIINAESLICLGSPFSSKTLQEASFIFSTKKSEKLRQLEKIWLENPSLNTFRQWLSHYGEFYFEPRNIPAGEELLRNDKSSYQMFLDNCRDIRNSSLDIAKLKAWPKRKLLLAGENDNLLPYSLLKADAQLAGIELLKVPQANHFLHLDNIEFVTNAIMSFLSGHYSE